MSNRKPKAVSLQPPSGKATWREPRNTFRKTNVKGRDRGHPLLSCPWAALPGPAQQPHARRTGQADSGQPPGTTVGTSHCLWANRIIFLPLENILETPMKETCFSCGLMGLKSGFLSSWVRENTGTPGRQDFLRLVTPRPRSAVPPPYLVHSQQAPSPAGHPLPPAPTWRTDAAGTAISYDCH